MNHLFALSLRTMTCNFTLHFSCLCHLLTEKGMQDLDADFYSLKDNMSGVGKVVKLIIYEYGPLLLMLYVIMQEVHLTI